MTAADALAAKYGLVDSAPSGADALAAKYGLEAPKTDVGPEARARAGRGMRPEPKSDQELGLDEGPQFPRDILGRPTTAKNNAGTEAYRVAHAGDEMNDPGAQALTAAAMAAPLAAVGAAAAPAALAPMVSGAISGGAQSAMQGGSPVAGAVLGAIPGAGRAARAADTAIGDAALERATAPGFGEGPSPIALKAGKYAGKAVGAAIGGKTAGPLGFGVGQHYGGKLGESAVRSLSNAGTKATNALAARRMVQLGAEEAARAPSYTPPESSAAPSVRGGPIIDADVVTPQSGAPGPRGLLGPMVNLSPLVHEPLPPPSSVPPGALGTPFVDEFGVPVTEAGPVGNHATVGGATAAGKAPSLLEDVRRDAQRFRGGDYDQPPAETSDVGDQMARSVQMLSDLKAARAAGTLSPGMVDDAIKAGMSKGAVKKAVGAEAFDEATRYQARVLDGMRRGLSLAEAAAKAGEE